MATIDGTSTDGTQPREIISFDPPTALAVMRRVLGELPDADARFAQIEAVLKERERYGLADIMGQIAVQFGIMVDRIDGSAGTVCMPCIPTKRGNGLTPVCVAVSYAPVGQNGRRKIHIFKPQEDALLYATTVAFYGEVTEQDQVNSAAAYLRALQSQTSQPFDIVGAALSAIFDSIGGESLSLADADFLRAFDEM